MRWYVTYSPEAEWAPYGELGRRWNRACRWTDDVGCHSLTIYRDTKRRHWLMHDPQGTTRFSQRTALAGPFKTFKGAKVAYVITEATQ